METFEVIKPLLTYSNPNKLSSESTSSRVGAKRVVYVPNSVMLTTKKAVELLLSGALRTKVCRFCLHVTSSLSELDEIMQIANGGVIYKVTIRDVVASFHPYKIADDKNIPNKICDKCLDKALQCYRFAQNCEQAERALRNCLDDMYHKLDKLDPLEQIKRRGRRKLNPNHNVLYTENYYVIDYAEPLYNLINVEAESLTKETEMGEFECKKCWQVLPNLESLMNHEKIHPKSMWYNCRLCGKSFVNRLHINRHLRQHTKESKGSGSSVFICKQCGFGSENYNVHLQHIEKHKYKMVLEHLVERKMDKLCTVCYDKNRKLVNLNKMICLHGGYAELTGDRTLQNILGSTLPEMTISENYTGTKICEKCLDQAITCYVFINKTRYVRNRLSLCVTEMLRNLKNVNIEKKIFIEVSLNSIMAIKETYNENLLLEDEDIDETKLPVEKLEGEFKLKFEQEIRSEFNDDKKVKTENPATGTKNDNVLVNGYKNITSNNLNEFLCFKNKEKVTENKMPKYTMCPLCNKRFISYYFMKKHILRHVFRRVKCTKCQRSFDSKFHLREHNKSMHLLKQADAYSCKTCGRMFRSEQKLLSHEKSHLSKQCELCSKFFGSQKDFDNHLQRHAAKLRISKRKYVLTCSFCEKQCPNDNDLSVHVHKMHLQIKPFACDMCEKQFYTEYDLKSHKKVHRMLRIEQCVFCLKTFKCRRDLVVHVRKHIGNTPFKCGLCPQKFYSESQTKVHMKKWHGGSFFCKLCRKVFVNKKGLKDHVNTAHNIF